MALAARCRSRPDGSLIFLATRTVPRGRHGLLLVAGGAHLAGRAYARRERGGIGRRRQSDMSPDPLVSLCKARMLSPDGRCKTSTPRPMAMSAARAAGSGTEAFGDALRTAMILALIRGWRRIRTAVERPYRAELAGAAGVDSRRARRGGTGGRRDRLCRGAWHRHRGRRSDRGRALGAVYAERARRC